jgi:hypothetical protein
MADVHIRANVMAVSSIGLNKRKCYVKLISNLDWKGLMHFDCALVDDLVFCLKM